MSNGILGFVAGLGTGYMGAKQRQEEKERQDRMDQITVDRAARETEQYNLEKADKAALRTAVAPAQLQAGAGGVLKPDTADNIDVGQPGEPQAQVNADNTAVVPGSATNGMSDQGFRVNGQGFATKDAAQGAATAYDKPEAKFGRYIQAMQGIDFAKAQAAQLTQVQLQEHQQTVADKALRKRVSGLKTPEEIATMISESPADGQGGALKVRAVVSGDGKAFSFIKVNPDGTEEPIPGGFANDEKGMEQARMKVAGYLTPEMRMQHYQWEQQQEQHASEFKETKQFQEKQLAETTRHNTADEKNTAAARGIAQATLDFQREKARLDDPTYNLPPAVKLQTQGLQAQVAAINKAYANALVADPAFENSPNAEALKRQMATANEKIGNLVSQYVKEDPKAKAAGGDKFGVRAAGAPPAAPAAATPAAVAAANGAAAPVKPAYVTSTYSDHQMEDVGRKAGYTPALGRDGNLYFSRVVNGQGENLAAGDLAKRLNVTY